MKNFVYLSVLLVLAALLTWKHVSTVTDTVSLTSQNIRSESASSRDVGILYEVWHAFASNTMR